MLQLGEYAPPIRVVGTCMGDFPPSAWHNPRKLIEILRQVEIFISDLNGALSFSVWKFLYAYCYIGFSFFVLAAVTSILITDPLQKT